ncbi:MAG: peptidylprolyl isomerase [Novosphingopyxis baekryungensis]|nr:peptidylprolyl isomerase [Novosphingopyxis baekryungensis]
MKKHCLAALVCALTLPSFGAFAQDAPAASPSPGEIVAQAPASEWVAIAPEDLLVMELSADRDGKPRRVVIQLMPPPYSQGWVGNIRKLAAAHWWDGTSVNRVQDNYVVQWGDASEEKPLPGGLATVPESAYVASTHITLKEMPVQMTAEERTEAMASAEQHRLEHWVQRDAYASQVKFSEGWPLGMDDKSSWPVHCYGMVGVGRNLSPDTGTGAELYTVIGQAPRHLDRNIALVGRVIEGMEHLSSLPRGTGDLGFYEDPAQRVPIVSARLATDLPQGAQPKFQYLSTEGATFARYADARANRHDPFFNVPAGGADICNIPVPVRKVTEN